MQLPETFAATCCQVIRDRRQRLGLSQEEVAKRSGLARSYICDVERGARHPSLRNVSTLAKALDIATSELIVQVELNLAIRVDMEALKANNDANGLHCEIIKYYNERMTDGLIIADQSGKLIFFNTAANQLTGVGQTDKSPEEWSDHFGIFKADKVTKCPTSELPLVRALAGESVDNAELFLKNHLLPEGLSIVVTGRPLKVNGGPPQGAVVVFHQV